MMNSIEQEIERIIDQRVKERVKSLTGKEEEIIECLKGFISEMDYVIKSTNEAIEDFNENNLTVGRIEEEGFLRGIITYKNNLLQEFKYHDIDLKLEENGD